MKGCHAVIPAYPDEPRSRGRQREQPTSTSDQPTPNPNRQRTPSCKTCDDGISIYSYLFLVILTNLLDIIMASPKLKSVPAYGSSRSTGGVLRGKALGNTFNMADADKTWQDINIESNGSFEKGKIHCYLSEKNPANIDVNSLKASFVVSVSNVARYVTIQDIICKAGTDYMPIQSKFKFKVETIVCSNVLVLEPSIHLFFLDDDDWIACGRYEVIMNPKPKPEDEIQWSVNNNKYAICILGVSLAFDLLPTIPTFSFFLQTTFEPGDVSLPGFAGRLGSVLGRSTLLSTSLHSGPRSSSSVRSELSH